MVVVQRKAIRKDDPAPVAVLKEFPADTVYTRNNAYMAPLYEHFVKKTGKHAILREVRNVSNEELIRRVSEGSVRFALCPENIAMVYHRFYTNLDISLLAFPLYSYAWGMTVSSDTLMTQLNGWIGEMKSSGDLHDTYQAYFNNQRIARFMESDYFSVTGTKLFATSPTVPATAGATGTTGEIAWDANYVYVCTATNTWKRAGIATW